MPSEFHNREPPYPSEFPLFFLISHFDLATPISTNEHEFTSPQGCDPVVPGDKLYSSATQKTYPFLSLNLAIKINNWGPISPTDNFNWKKKLLLTPCQVNRDTDAVKGLHVLQAGVGIDRA